MSYAVIPGMLVMLRADLHKPVCPNYVVIAVNPWADQIVISPEESEDGDTWQFVTLGEIV